ncbi:hypothetical protein NAPIS_ORF02062 [Vairimorpha apis BRL 01]|uniref:Uncharacterized protein n=1 Tax=Vairimorpha apis BRL 01 TaxID=1037528 RepID=T0MH38_9MICR|nr:hypothetical protein NAPIS_ORF02062 [Vairimorpha apis BRL 01]
MITIKKPKSPHQSTLSLITLLTSTIKNSIIVTSHPLNSKIQIDIIQDVLPKYLIIYKPNKIRIALKILGESLAMLLMDIFHVMLIFLYFRMYKFCFSKSGPVFNRDGPILVMRKGFWSFLILVRVGVCCECREYYNIVSIEVEKVFICYLYEDEYKDSFIVLREYSFECGWNILRIDRINDIINRENIK